jgi:hypothetical protein
MAEDIQVTQLFKPVVTGSLNNPAPTTYSHNGGTTEVNPPQASLLGDAALAGEQMMSNIAKGIQQYSLNGVTIGTGINFANKNQHHICEPIGLPRQKRTTITTPDGIEVPNLALGSPALELKIIMHSAKVQEFLGKVRKAIEDAFSVAGGPAVNSAKELIKFVAETVREINKFAKLVIVSALLAIQVAQWIDLLVKFITGLPAILAEAFAECVEALKNALQDAITFSILPGDETTRMIQEVQNLQKNLQLAQQVSQQLVASVQQIAIDITNIPTGVNAAVDIMTKSLANIKSTPPKPIVNVSIF